MGKSILIYFLIFLVIGFNESKAQSEFKRNTVFGELGGSSFLVSINFDNVIPFWPYLSFGYSF